MAKHLRHQWIKDMLADKGVSQRDLARMWDVTDGAISKFLASGEGVQMTYARVKGLAGVFEMTPDEVHVRLEELPYAPAHVAVLSNVDVGSGQVKPDQLDHEAHIAYTNLTTALEAARKAFAPLKYKIRCTIEQEL